MSVFKSYSLTRLFGDCTTIGTPDLSRIQIPTVVDFCMSGNPIALMTRTLSLFSIIQAMDLNTEQNNLIIQVMNYPDLT